MRPSAIDTLLKTFVPVDFMPHAQVCGRLTRVVGLTLEASGLNVSIGDGCLVETVSGNTINTEVIGFSADKVYLMPFDRSDRLRVGARVYPSATLHRIAVGPELLGRVIDGLGRPLDRDHLAEQRRPVVCNDAVELEGPAINPLVRQPIRQPLDVGIRSINGLLTIGKGQRIGLFAGSGVGKSVLLGMMTRFTEAEIVVVSLIGERGREVREFIESNLGKEGMKKAIVVASPADDAPLMRLRASYAATRIAEYFRDKGKTVLLLMDSLTRFAQAQREIALAAGEPPATRGYPPSVFARLPQLVERAGNAASGTGSLTAIYTVLAEGDDLQDPVVDAARAILDGHIVLSRQLAEEGMYPAIDIEASISRVMSSVVDSQGLARALQFKKYYSLYRKNRDLVNIGAYVTGSNADLDRAIERYPYLLQYVAQAVQQPIPYSQAQQELRQAITPPATVAAPLQAR